MDHGVRAAEEPGEVGLEDVGFMEAVIALRRQAEERAVALGGEVVDHHDFGLREGGGQVADQARAYVPQGSGDDDASGGRLGGHAFLWKTRTTSCSVATGA